MTDEDLALLVASGASVRRIADQLGLPPSAVRRRLDALGLETVGTRNRRLNRDARRAGARELRRVCRHHGETVHRVDRRGTFRCARCVAERVIARRREMKQILVAEAGGACRICGYDRCVQALEFHHVAPDDKAFGIALRGHSRSLARAREEAAKCVLLCSNCHVEVEAGVTVVPLQ